MDTVTHALGGALLGRALGERSRLPPRRALWLGALVGAFPDSDFVLRFVFDPITFLNLHRGVTHSLVMVPLWGILLALLFAAVFRRDDYRPRDYFVLAAAAIVLHIIFDVITSFGTQILAPLSHWKASIPTTFIIDPIFSGIIIAGLAVSRSGRRARRAVAAFSVLLCYVLFQGAQWQRALGVAEASLQAQGFAVEELTALPQPLSPFHWKLIARNGESYRVAYLSLWRDTPPEAVAQEAGMVAKVWSLYRPADALLWDERRQFGSDGSVIRARELWQDQRMEGVRRFIVHPTLQQVELRNEGRCYWFTDLRFEMKAIRSPFVFGPCVDGEQWRIYRKNGEVLNLVS